MGGGEIQRAVTRVKSEQAPKVLMRLPTPLHFGEGRANGESNRQTHPLRSAGVMGTARWKGDAGYQGRPVLSEGSGLNVAFRRWLGRASDRVVGLLMSGNAGGGKGPDFRYAS